MNSHHSHRSGVPQNSPEPHTQTTGWHPPHPHPSYRPLPQPPQTAVGTHPPAAGSHRELENFFLNIALYLGSLFIVAASSLMIYTLAPRPFQVTLLGVLVLLFCATGASTYQWVPQLRLASYTFAGTGLALIPLFGLALYHSYWPYSGASLWLLISAVGTLAVIGALALMQARVMSYLAIAFIVSDVLAFNRTLQTGLLWYFVGLILLATLISIFSRALGSSLPLAVTQGFNDSSRIFVPITVLVSLLMPSLAQWEVALIAVLASSYALAHLKLQPLWLYYLQARIYPLLALLYLSFWVTSHTGTSTYAFLPATLFLLASAVFLQQSTVFLLPWPRHLDALATWAFAQVGLVASSITLMQQTSALPSLFGGIWRFTQAETLLAALILLSLATLGIILREAPTSPYLPYLALTLGGLSYLLYPPMAQLSALLGLSGLILWVKPASNRQNQFLAALFVGAAPLTVVLGLVADENNILALVLYGALSSLYLLHCLWGKSPTQTVPWPVPHALAPLAYLFASVSVITVLSFLVPVGLYETATPDFFDSLVLALFTLYAASTTAAFLALVNQHHHESRTLLLVFAYLGVLGSAGLLALKFSAVHLLWVVAGYLLGALLPLSWATSATMAHSFLWIRCLVVLVALKTLLSSQLQGSTTTLVLVVLSALLAGTSIYLATFRQEISSPRSERRVALTFSWLCALITLTLIEPSWSWRPLVATGVLLALVLAWFMQAGHPGVQAAQGVLLAAGLIASGQMLLTFGLQLDTSPMLFFLGCALVCIPKLLAVLLARSNHQPQVPVGKTVIDPLGRWGSQHNKALTLPGLVLGTLTLLVPVFDTGRLGLGILAIFTMTCGWLLTSKPRSRPTVTIVGLGLLLLRACIELGIRQAFFYMVQYLVIALALLSVYYRMSRKPLPPGLPVYSYTGYRSRGTAPFWTAFSLQATGSLLFLPFADVLINLPEKIVLLIVTAVLLGSAVLLASKTRALLSALLLTYQLLLLLGGLNFFTLFMLGLTLIGLVTWRLLSRDDKPQLPPGPPQPLVPPFAPPAPPQQPLPPSSHLGSSAQPAPEPRHTKAPWA
ncbi:hypothetical protein [Rothia nasimurium]|uniref:hypothetical protein n=1 Tax=Rothia nasimurium TaxID=85336 RepID=UPI003BA13113